MKKIIQLAFFSFSLFGFSQTFTENFVKTTTYKGPGGTLPVSQVTYFDGLGRSVQQLAQGQSATGKDIITHIEYDSIGRQKKDYLPYAGTSNTMSFDPSGRTSTESFYADPTKIQETTTVPFSQKLFEASPLNRVFKQAAPGYDWRLGGGKEIKLDYQTNTGIEVKKFVVTATWNATSKLYDISIATSGNYVQNQLYKTITTDENNSQTHEFKDKEGKVVLKRTFDNSLAHDTYYVYDIYGNLTYVIPPQANGSIAQVDIDGLCYQYKYDNRNRLVEKKLPGKLREFIVYDQLDRVVATGPALSPWGIIGDLGWMITKYDALSRPVYTGWVEIREPMTTLVRANYQNNQNEPALLFETKTTSGTIDGVAVNYSNNVSPTYFKLLTVNYYDDYLFPNMPPIPTTVLGEDVFYNNTQKPKGLPTGSLVRVLDNSSSTSNEMSYTLYDKMAKPIRSFTKNHLGGYTQVDSQLDFVGKTIATETRHKRLVANLEILVREDFTYTAQDRLLTRTHSINGGTTQSLSQNEYTELGQLKTKLVGTNLAFSRPLQKVDYSYNIRGWLTDINTIGTLVDRVANDLFAFKINYNNTEENATPLFNGNIATTNWRTASDDVLRKYSYDYDQLNRLKYAHYQKPGIRTQRPGSYDESLTYDKNGNIQTLNRFGYLDNDSGTVVEIDNLEYNYNYNQLHDVADYSNSINGFKNGNSSGEDYRYDVNGNMIVDKNKGILNIAYNHLNLPTSIAFENEKYIAYIYNAVGVKLQKFVEDAVNPVRTDYLNGFQYNSAADQVPYNGLQFFPHAEGYVDVFREYFSYVYNYTDHLGNIRLSYGEEKQSGFIKIIEENNYYPFGLKHVNYNAQEYDFKETEIGNYVVIEPTPQNDYQYKYQGQERQDELGLNWDSFKWRNYDYAIGRFMSIDPLAEKYSYNSTYAFQENKMGMGREIEGLEMMPWDQLKFYLAGKVAAFRNGASEVANTVVGNDKGATQPQPNVNGYNVEKVGKISEVAKDSKKNLTKVVRNVANALEDGGDKVTIASAVTVQPEGVAIGKVMSATGNLINEGLDLGEGKPATKVGTNLLTSFLLGKAGGKVVDKAVEKGVIKEHAELFVKEAEKKVEQTITPEKK